MKSLRHPFSINSQSVEASSLSSFHDLSIGADKQALPVSARPSPRRSTGPTRGAIRVSILSMGNMHRYGEMFHDLLQIRRRVFIEKRGWELPSVDGYEFDQYDNPFSRWLVLHRYGEILAGVRLTPTTAQCGIYTYMIRDAQRGLLEDIPSDLLICEAPVSPKVWEASRIFVTDDVPARDRLIVRKQLLQAITDAAYKEGAKFVIGIVPHLWKRWSSRLDLDSGAFGPKREIAGEVCQVALLKTKLDISKGN
ncbi:acyl-homoserine-lactone synthase [Neptunicoccus cionae]|uniref:acyl-homoserine-lactone synthase n=1 Tax=Neptunicoccus cionae TaxID=2035344 RepID=UPI0025712C65|nr:acyl-homoserine-lactone synthase [Amylibacter cionae]